MSVIYHLKGVVKSRAVNGVGFRLVVPSIQIKDREAVALVGYSGSGKSTLLDLLALVLKPDEAGRFTFLPRGVRPTDVAAIWKAGGQDTLSDLRKRHIGYVLQTGGLLPYLTVGENIGLSRRLLGLPADGTVEHLARILGVERHLSKLPAFLSAGERQRVAFARALAHRPSIVIADEPTASLDPITARRVLAAVMDLVKELGWATDRREHSSTHRGKRQRKEGGIGRSSVLLYHGLRREELCMLKVRDIHPRRGCTAKAARCATYRYIRGTAELTDYLEAAGHGGEPGGRAFPAGEEQCGRGRWRER